MNSDQEKVFEAIKLGKNTFITGGAGVGKSYLVHEIVKYLVESKINYSVTAMTGCASVLINGRTIHSFMGIGLAKGSIQELFKKIARNKNIYKRLIDLRVLILDVVSMLSDELFDKISKLFSLIHQTDRPFGILQVIFVGDMSQLKPIEGDYCFKSKYWKQCEFNVTILTQNMRISGDQLFKEILDRLRWGKCTDDDLDVLNELRITEFPDGIIPTRLFSKNKDVDALNNIELNKLINTNNPDLLYEVLYIGNSIKKKASSSYITSQKILETLKLCVGAQVIVTRNIDPDIGIVNGTRGTVVKIDPEFVSIKLLNGTFYTVMFFNVKADIFNDLDRNIDFKYIPLKLAWGVSIHSSQGMTIDALEIDLGASIFTEEQAYTGLSRARNMNSIKITRLLKSSFKTNKDVIAFYKLCA